MGRGPVHHESRWQAQAHHSRASRLWRSRRGRRDSSRGDARIRGRAGGRTVTAEVPASAVPTVQIDNDTVRVTEWRFAPGATTGFHRHDFEYVVVPMTTGRLAINDTVTAELTAGRSYTRPAGVAHDVRNANAFE